MMMPYIVAFITAVIPTMAVYYMQRKIRLRDEVSARKTEEARAERREADKKRTDCDVMLVQAVNASIALGEATAHAIKKSGQFQVNGEMDEALKYAQEVKHKQRDFYQRQGVEYIHRKGE